MSTETGAFDATSYRQRVLAALRSAPSLDLSDPFFIVDLPVDVDDTELIRARITALVGFWNKERNPNYKALTAELAARRADLEAVLLNPVRRAERADQVRAARAAADADRFAVLDSLAGKLVARYSGLPRSRLAGLARLARSRGIDDAAFATWTQRQHVIEDGGADAEPLPAAVRAQIRGDLDEFGRITGEQARAATLWAFLSLTPATPAAQVASRHAELAARNEHRQHDRQMTVVANLLAYVRQHLIDGDPARYAASLIEEAKDRIRDTVAEKVIVEDELSADDYEACVRRVLGFGLGLSGEQARLAVRRVATDLGAALTAAPAAAGHPVAAPAESAGHGTAAGPAGNATAASSQSGLPLVPPSALRVRAGADAVALTWDPVPAAGPVTYKVSRLTSDPGGGPPRPTPLGSTSATAFEDAGVPGGAIVAHEVRAVAGSRTSGPVTSRPVLMARDIAGLTARPDTSGVTLTWSLPISAGQVIIERAADPRAGVSLPPRRARADGPSWRDAGMVPGVEFRYRVFAEYRDADDTLVRTAGAEVTASVVPRPQPVREIWARTAGGRTTIGWVRPPGGEVRIFAAGAALARPGAEVDLAGLAGRARYVGTGQRRVSDEHPGKTVITYTAVTVAGGLAVAGACVAHLAVAAPGNAVVTDAGAELVLTFTLPPGVTEAVVAARRDVPPAGPHDPAAQTWTVTNAKLEIDGGLHVPAPPDGRRWYFGVYSVLRDGANRVAAPAGAVLAAR